MVLTGVSLAEGQVGAGYFDRITGTTGFAMAHQEPAHFPGTGDLFASVLLGALMRGDELPGSVEQAVNFVQRCVAHTLKVGTPPVEGVQFEPMLGELVR